MKNLTEYVNERGLLPRERKLQQMARTKAATQKFGKTAQVMNYVFKSLDNLLSV